MDMHSLNFICPHCREAMELSFEEPAQVLVMACAHCKTPLMYYHGEVFEVDSMEIGNLQQKHLKAVQGYLKVHDLESPALGVRRRSQLSLPPATHRRGQPVMDRVVSSEDIINLRIDLETSEDVEDFLRRI